MEKGGQVAPHLGIGVFLDGQRTGGVADKEGQKTVTLACGEVAHAVGEFVKPRALGRDGETLLHPFGPQGLTAKA